MKHIPNLNLVRASYVAECLGIPESRVYSAAAMPHSELVMLVVKGRCDQRDSYVFIEESVEAEVKRLSSAE